MIDKSCVLTIYLYRIYPVKITIAQLAYIQLEANISTHIADMNVSH